MAFDANKKEWTLMQSGQMHGPYSANELAGFLARRSVTARHPVWRPGMRDAMQMTLVPELAPMVAAATSPETGARDDTILGDLRSDATGTVSKETKKKAFRVALKAQRREERAATPFLAKLARATLALGGIGALVAVVYVFRVQGLPDLRAWLDPVGRIPGVAERDLQAMREILGKTVAKPGESPAVFIARGEASEGTLALHVAASVVDGTPLVIRARPTWDRSLASLETTVSVRRRMASVRLGGTGANRLASGEYEVSVSGTDARGFASKTLAVGGSGR